MTPEQIIARMSEQREAWVDLPTSLDAGGKALSVRVVRPAEADFGQYLKPADDGQVVWSCTLDQVKSVVTGWRGFKESTLIRGGADDELTFAPMLWHAWVADHVAAAVPVAQRVVEMLAAHQLSAVDIEKN